MYANEWDQPLPDRSDEEQPFDQGEAAYLAFCKPAPPRLFFNSPIQYRPRFEMDFDPFEGLDGEDEEDLR